MLLTKLLNQYLTKTSPRHASGPRLATLRKRAALLGVGIEIERDSYGTGYWLTGTGWDDGNFCESRVEIAAALDQLEQLRQ